MQEQRVLSVAGMTCDHCTAAVEREVRALARVHSATASLHSGTVFVLGEQLDDAALVAAVDEAGYDATVR